MCFPTEIINILEKLKSSRFEAYAVGGCVRDFLLARRSKKEGEMNVEPKDWDITTNAKPEEIQKIFPKSFYKNKFGTVTVQIKNEKIKVENDNVKCKIDKSQNQEFAEKFTEAEITPFRTEEKYSDKRHPDKIHWAKTLEEDLARRDFTVNAMALSLSLQAVASRQLPASSRQQEADSGKQKAMVVIDLFDGQKDLKNKIIRTVGKPEDRFSEDALRMMRAVRFAVQLNFVIEPKTFKAIQKNAHWLKMISKERIRDELIKIILSDNPDKGILLLKDAGLLKFIIPELEKGIGVSQNRHHIYTIFQHLILSLKYCPSKKLEVRLAALFHDIAKPETKSGNGPDATFYNHDIVGAKYVWQIMSRLKFPRKIIEKTSLLVRYHMFYYNVDEVSEAGVRRLVRKAGLKNMKDLIDLRISDRLGSGVPKAKPYKLRHLEYLIQKVSKDPISVKMLKVSGEDIMKILKISPGPKIGAILNALLAEVLENPELNKKETLKKRVKDLGKKNIQELSQKSKEIEEKKEEIDLEEKKKFYVK
jgi:poly(A) polymerase/tRNA nucleotidyltransferase (CCA-adding enzyme)